MRAKMFMQTLCRIKLGWDNVLDEKHETQWLHWTEDLPKLQEIQLAAVSNQKGLEKFRTHNSIAFQMVPAPVMELQCIHALSMTEENSLCICDWKGSFGAYT